MKKIITLTIMIFAVLTLFVGTVSAVSGDENYFGENGEQPATNVEDSYGEGLPNESPDIGDTTRAKDLYYY